MSDTERPNLGEHVLEQLSCRVMPQLDEDVTCIEITDWDGNKSLLDVPSESVMPIRMPRLSRDMPGFVKEPFESGIGLGLVACQRLNAFEELVTVELPTEPPTSVVVKDSQLARKR